MKRKVFIYGIRPKHGGDFFYVGSTVRPLKARLAQHCNGHNQAVVCRVNELGRNNVEIVLLDTVDEARRFEREYQIITEYRESGIALLNIQLSPDPPIWIRRPSFLIQLRDLVTLLESPLKRHKIRCDCGGDCVNFVPDLHDAKVLQLKKMVSSPRFPGNLKLLGLESSPELDVVVSRINALPTPRDPGPFDERVIACSLATRARLRAA